MLKLMKYMKAYAWLLILAIALLYGQAMADLALPDYMSKIVNVGIQQNGNEDVIPSVIREEEFDKYKGLMNPEYLNDFVALYEAVEPNSARHGKLAVVYTLHEEQPFYELKVEQSGIDQTLKAEIAKGTLLLLGSMSTNGQESMSAEGEMTPEAFMGLLENETLLMQASQQGTLVLYEMMGVDLDAVRSRYIMMVGLMMLGITVLGAAASIAVGFIASKVAAGLGRDLRKRIFAKVSRFSNAEFDKFSTASLITRSTNDVMQVQTLMVMMIRMIFYAPIMGIGGIIRALEKNSSMSWIIALAVGLLLIMIATVFMIAMPKFKLVQKLVDRVNLVTRENLTGMMVIRAFNTQKFEEKRFEQANQDLTDTNLFVSKVMVFLMPMMMFIMNGVTLLIIWVGAKEIEASNMQVGDMMAFMQYAMQIIMSFLMMSMMFIMIPRASVAAGRIVEVLDTEAQIVDPKKPKKLGKQIEGIIEFKDVSFRYPGAEEDMIKNISFVAKPGQTTAIIGSTGSGKTTMVNLIPRLYDVTEGEIFLDGHNIKTLAQKDLRQHIGYIPQKASLFSGDITSNLKFANEIATELEMAEAIEIAQATEFVDAKEDKMLTHIAQGGANVSGGQKQRLSIARALVKRPKIYIFDDSFSALDFKTDRTLRQALKSKTGDSTLIIVAQRISTIKQAEQILVIDDGKLVGQGTHDALMLTCETYQEIAYSQLSKEELA